MELPTALRSEPRSPKTPLAGVLMTKTSLLSIAAPGSHFLCFFFWLFFVGWFFILFVCLFQQDMSQNTFSLAQLASHCVLQKSVYVKIWKQRKRVIICSIYTKINLSFPFPPLQASLHFHTDLIHLSTGPSVPTQF